MPGLSTSVQIPQWHRTDKYPSSLLNDGVDTAQSTRFSGGISCTASATPHSVGAWVELDAALSADCDGIYVIVSAGTDTSATNTSSLLEIGTGASTAEVTWARASVGFRRSSGNAASGEAHWIPGFIPAGTRVAIRCQSVVASKVVTCKFNFFRADKSRNFGTPIEIGTVTASSRGTSLTAPGSLNTKGVWTVLTASSSQAISAIAVMPQTNSNAAMNASGMLLDIGTGADTAEVVRIADIYLPCNNLEYMTPQTYMTYGVDIPSGTRIVARYARANTNNTCDVFLVCA